MMIRTATLALVAAAALSAPAFAITPTQVRLDGRTSAQIRADVTTIAHRLCTEKFGSDTASVDACVLDAVRATMKKVMARGAYVWSTAAADD